MKEARTQEELACRQATEPLCDRYEQLRSFVLHGSGLKGQFYGLGVLLRQGMIAWMAACVEQKRFEASSDNRVYQLAPGLAPSIQAELTRTLASLVLNHNKREVEDY